MEYYLVIDVGGTFIKYAQMDEQCQILEKGKRPTPQDSFEEFVQALCQIYQSYQGKVAGIAISSAGVIDSAAGYMENAGSLLYIKQVNLKHILEEKCGVPVTLENDARCAGLAEVWKGALSDCRNAAVFIIGTAVGGAVIIDRKIFPGRHLMAGEFSYLLTNAQDAGNPSRTFAKIGGMPGLLSEAELRLGKQEDGIDGERLFFLADEGNQTAIGCIRGYARQLAVQLLNLQFVLDPERIAIGGGVSAQNRLISMIREELEKLSGVYPHAVPLPEIVACRFFNDSNLIGALYTHLQQQGHI